MIEKIDDLLCENMTERGFKFWRIMKNQIPPVWDRLASSSKKYHKKKDGSVPTIAEHTYEMLYAASKVINMFKIKPKTKEADLVYLSIALHDAFKYGLTPEFSDHTTPKHDKIVADVVVENKHLFEKVFNDAQVDMIEESVRYHSGSWSTDADNNFSLSQLSPEALFVHFLDMLSSRDLLKVS